MTDENCINNIVSFCFIEGKGLPKSFPMEKLNDEKFLLEVVAKRPMTVFHLKKFVPEKYLNNDSFIKKVAEINGNAISFASAELLADKDFVLNAINKNPEAFRFAPDYLRDDKKLVSELIEKNGYILGYASDRLKKDPELIEASATNIAKTESIARNLTPFNTKAFAKILLPKNASLFLLLDKELQNDRELALYAVARCEHCYMNLNNELKKDREIVLEAVKSFSSVYKILDADFKKDIEIAAYAFVGGSKTVKSSIPTNIRYSTAFRSKISEIQKGNKIEAKTKPSKEVANLPKFTVNKDKNNPSMATISVDWNGKKEKLSTQIEIRNRFIFAIDDYVQPTKNVVLFRYLFPSYDKEIEQIYNSLPTEIKNLILHDDFSKQIKKKLKDKETCTYREIRFAFRKCDKDIKVFTFYNPHNRTEVVSYMGVYMAHPRAWYVKDLEQAMKQIKDFKNKAIPNLKGVESRATDEASYFELMEMNYTVHIEKVDIQKTHADPLSFINNLVNVTFKEAKDDEEEPIGNFDLRQYESFIQVDDNLRLPKDFKELFIKALDDAK